MQEISFSQKASELMWETVWWLGWLLYVWNLSLSRTP